MLIFIENCVPNDYLKSPLKMKSLQKLLESHSEKNNIVIGSKKVMNSIVNSSHYSHYDKKAAFDILECRSENKQLKETLELYCIIDFHIEKSTLQNESGKLIPRLSYKEISAPRHAEPVLLITENARDYELFSFAAEAYLKANFSSKIAVKFNNILGAGSHSKEQFDTCSEHNPFVLCIVDNDKSHPKKGEGSTSSSFTTADRKLSKSKLAIVLNQREIENIIPLKYLEELCKVPNTSDAFVDTFDELKPFFTKKKNFRSHFDHKDGLSLKQAIALDKKYGDFWLPMLEEYNKFKTKDCFIEKECFGCNSCPKIDGFGSNLLQQFNNYLKSENLIHLNNKIEDNLRETWSNLGLSLVSWGCAPNTKTIRTT